MPTLASALRVAFALALICRAASAQGPAPRVPQFPAWPFDGPSFTGSPLADRGPPNRLITAAANKSVQKELGVSEEVAKRLTALPDEFRNRARARYAEAGIDGTKTRLSGAESQKTSEIQAPLIVESLTEIERLLSAQQYSRLKQIRVQMYGIDALRVADLAAELRLTDDQRKKIDDVYREYQKQIRSTFAPPAKGEKAADRVATTRELNREHDKEMLNVLTAEQQTQFAAMKGAAFNLRELNDDELKAAGRGPAPAAAVAGRFPAPAFGGPQFEVRGRPRLAVVNEEKQPVEKFEVMIHTPDKGYHPWQRGSNGTSDLGLMTSFFSASSKIDVLVRAEGYASAVQSFTGEDRRKLLSEGATIALERGREVRLQLRVPSGMSFPNGFSPEVYFPDFAWRVETMWQPVNRRGGIPLDFNMLAVKAVGGKGGDYVLRLPKERREFFVGIYHPGWLRYFKAGPFTSDDFKEDQLTIDVPRAGTIAVNLDWGKIDAGDLAFNGVQYELMRPTREGSGSVWIADQKDGPLDGMPLEVTDLAPGRYTVSARTKSKMGEERPGPDSPIDPGRFVARTNVDLKPGQVIRENIPYVPFDPHASRGDRTSRLRITGVDGLPAAGKQLQVQWFDGRYGSHSIFNGPIPADGLVTLEGISSAVPYDAPFGPYHVEVAGERLGFFRVAPEGPVQEFSFHLVPKAGDTAPDAEFVALDSGERTRLKQLRGQIVYLEFWETGCGPCQAPMAKLNEIVATKAAEWSGKVALIPLCLDAEPQAIANHVKTRGWTNLGHYRSERSGGEYFADAARAFGVMAYPTAFLIDADGKITWRGHPSQHDLVSEVQKLQRLSEARP